MKNKKLLLVLVVAMSFALMVSFVVEPDYLWHIKAGEYMFKHGVLKKDIFSWYVSGKYWMSHEWLFEIIIYTLKLLFGKMHSFIYCFFSLLSLLLIIYYVNRDKMIKNIPYTLLFLLLFSIISFSFIQVRPHMISNIFVALTIYILYDLYNNKDSKKIYILPIITILWANIHGGSSNLSYLLCLVFFISGLVSFSFKKIEAKKFDKIQLKKYILVMFLCMISVCINIHGFKMFIYPYTNLLDNVMIKNISEWQSTSLHESYHIVYYICLLFFIFTMLFSNKKIVFIDFVLLGFCAYLGLKSIRFWFYTPIIMSFFTFNYVKERKVDSGTSLIFIILIILCLGVFIGNNKNIINPKYSLDLDKDIVDILKKEKPKRLFNIYDFGGELIYNDIPVFVDGRADLYSKYNYRDYLDISNLNGNFIKLINKYDFDYLLVRRKMSLDYYLLDSNKYEVIYKNKKLVLYKKNSI